jgi:flagellar motor switch protein FliN
MMMALSNAENDALKKVLNQFLKVCSETLGATINVEVEAKGTLELIGGDSLSDVPDLYDTDDPIMGVFEPSKVEASPLLWVLKSQQAKVMADFMMGGTGAPDEEPLSDLQLSAIGEALNQMVNAGHAALSDSLGVSTPFKSPQVESLNAQTLTEQSPAWSAPVLSVYGELVFKREDLQDSLEFVWVIPEPLSQQWAEAGLAAEAKASEMAASSSSPAGASAGDPSIAPNGQAVSMDLGGLQNIAQNLMQQAATGNASAATPAAGSASGGTTAPLHPEVFGSSANVSQHPQATTAQAVQFGSFDQFTMVSGAQNGNLELLMDVRLNLSVELGRTRLSLRDVLALTRGSVVELNRIAGESVDLLANGKLIAKGEVVVIEDNFGLRVTSIVAPGERLKGLQT